MTENQKLRLKELKSYIQDMMYNHKKQLDSSGAVHGILNSVSIWVKLIEKDE